MCFIAIVYYTEHAVCSRQCDMDTQRVLLSVMISHTMPYLSCHSTWYFTQRCLHNQVLSMIWQLLAIALLRWIMTRLTGQGKTCEVFAWSYVQSNRLVSIGKCASPSVINPLCMYHTDFTIP